MNVTLPWYVSGRSVDSAIMSGLGIDLDIMCRACGSWGEYDVWTAAVNGLKLCPKCGSYDTERAGDKR